MTLKDTAKSVTDKQIKINRNKLTKKINVKVNQILETDDNPQNEEDDEANITSKWRKSNKLQEPPSFYDEDVRKYYTKFDRSIQDYEE